MRKVAIAAVALAAGGSAVFLTLQGGEHTAPAAAQPAPSPAIPVTPGTVAAADMPVFLSGIGTVQAFNMVTIKSRVDGQIVRVLFSEGQEVKAGDPLFQIDPRPYQAALDQALAAKAKEVAQLQAAIKGDEAQIAAAKLNLGYSDIRAPIDGRLSARLVDVGNMVHANDTNGLVTIAQLKPIFVSFTVAQTNLDAIRQAQAHGQLLVRAYGNDNKTLLADGRLTLIDNAIDQATGTIHLKASFPNKDERLWPGEFVNLRLVLDTRHGVPTVPAQTVQEGPDGKYVYIIKPDSIVERRAVEVADVQDGVAVITKGLAPGEQVVVDGQYRLTNGARVNTGARPAGATG